LYGFLDVVPVKFCGGKSAKTRDFGSILGEKPCVFVRFVGVFTACNRAVELPGGAARRCFRSLARKKPAAENRAISAGKALTSRPSASPLRKNVSRETKRERFSPPTRQKFSFTRDPARKIEPPAYLAFRALGGGGGRIEMPGFRRPVPSGSSKDDALAPDVLGWASNSSLPSKPKGVSSA
jgi:hypothetical protein